MIMKTDGEEIKDAKIWMVEKMLTAIATTKFAVEGGEDIGIPLELIQQDFDHFSSIRTKLINKEELTEDDEFSIGMAAMTFMKEYPREVRKEDEEATKNE